MPSLVLASASPRRRVLLSLLGLEFRVVAPQVDETPRPDEDAHVLVERLARAKAEAIDLGDHEVLIAADTVVAIGGDILGKPADRADAERMLRALRGRPAEVVTGLAVRRREDLASHVERSTLHVRPVGDDAIASYLATGEADDKAGALAVQGAGADLIDRIEGSRSNVYGLPLRATAQLLADAGVEVPRLPASTA